MKPSDLGLPSKFTDFRRNGSFDQLAIAADLAATDDPRFLLLSAAPGCGKSLIYMTAAALRGNVRTLVLVGTKSLQRQVVGDFPRARWIWGHRNYPCAARAAAFGLDTDDPEFRCSYPRDSCPYLLDVEAARGSSVVVANYAYWMSLAKYSDPGLIGTFDLLIMDEAHTAPYWLTDFVAIELRRASIKKWLGCDLPALRTTSGDLSAWAEWARGSMTTAYTLAADDKRESGERRRLLQIARDLATISTAGNDNAREQAGWEEPWIVIRTDDGVKFTPRWGRDFSEHYLFRAIPHVILTSATLTPGTGDYLGIPRDDSRYIEVPSPFDPRRRPIVWVPTTRVSYKMSDGARYKLYRRVDEIVDAARSVEGQNGGRPFKGLIQTQSYDRAKELLAESRHRDLMISHANSRELRDALMRFEREEKFSIFVSPSVKEGVDFWYVYWQIVLKMPFLYSQDPLTKLRATGDDRYQWVVMGEDLLQMFGRVVRSERDFGSTYLIDDMWAFVRKEAPFPTWSKAAWKVQGGVTPPLTAESVAKLPAPLPEVRIFTGGAR